MSTVSTSHTEKTATQTQNTPEESPMPIDERSNAIHRSLRLKSLREMTGLSRDMIMKRYSIARGTLQNWETARFGGLTAKGARNIIRAFQAEGIQCNSEWLLHGIGPGPTFSENTTNNVATSYYGNKAGQSKQVDNELSLITQELLYFRQSNTDSIDIVVQDDSMSPRYLPGDYIAGIRRYKEDIERLIGLACIVQTAEYGTLLRQLLPGEQPDLYHLLTHARGSHIGRPVLYNVEVIACAPVVWVRRLSPVLLQK